MTPENKKWDRLKAEYLNQVAKALSSVKHPRVKDILNDVRSHLDRRFAELTPDHQTRRNMQAVITEMGPPSDYAELLDPDTALTRQDVQRRYLLWLSLAAIVIIAAAILLPIAIFSEAKPVTLEEFRHNFHEKVARLNIDRANLDDVIRIFGEPIDYIWGNQTFEKKNLPRRYVVIYPDRFHVYMNGNQIIELRHEGPGTGYAFLGKLKVGVSLDEVIELLGEPEETVVGEKNWFRDAVLYKDIEGRKGHCYYARQDRNVRLWFTDYKLWAIYVTRSDYGQCR